MYAQMNICTFSAIIELTFLAFKVKKTSGFKIRQFEMAATKDWSHHKSVNLVEMLSLQLLNAV